MDDRTFDELARSLASRTNRRRFFQGGALTVAAVGGILRAAPADAARRGQSSSTTICRPDGGGGYTRDTVATSLVPFHVATGAVLDNGCCSETNCTGAGACSTSTCDPQSGTCTAAALPDDTACTPEGPIDLCRGPYTCQQGVCEPGDYLLCAEIGGGCQRLIGCNPATGNCEYGPVPDGTSCGRANGCVPGVCEGGICFDPPAQTCASTPCRPCGYDSCNDMCTCLSIGCHDPSECIHSYCDDAQGGCVFEPIKEGEICGETGDGSQLCVGGVCTSVNPV